MEKHNRLRAPTFWWRIILMSMILMTVLVPANHGPVMAALLGNKTASGEGSEQASWKRCCGSPDLRGEWREPAQLGWRKG